MKNGPPVNGGAAHDQHSLTTLRKADGPSRVTWTLRGPHGILSPFALLRAENLRPPASGHPFSKRRHMLAKVSTRAAKLRRSALVIVGLAFSANTLAAQGRVTTPKDFF